MHIKTGPTKPSIYFQMVKLPESAHCASQRRCKSSELPSLPLRSRSYPSWEQLTVEAVLLCDEACIPGAKPVSWVRSPTLGCFGWLAPVDDRKPGRVHQAHCYYLCSQLGRREGLLLWGSSDQGPAGFSELSSAGDDC